MEVSTELMFAFIGAVLGIIVGAVGYRFASKSQHNVVAMQQKLLESERQLAELKSRMGSHLLDFQQRLDTIRDEASELEKQLNQEAQHWNLGNDTLPHLDLSGLSNTQANEEGATAPSTTNSSATTGPAATGAPRDYADGQSGTLSEDFGLKEADTPPQPPRY
ncbi:MAG: ZapG family protein [Pseudomonadota bacterium]